MMEVGIRLATGTDLAAVQQVVAAAYGGYVARIGREPGPMRDDYAARIAAGEVWVAGANQVDGLIVLLPADGHLLLDNVAVAPARKGQGLGAALLAFAEAEARRRGVPELRLYTHVRMVENIALYARSGWEETGRGQADGFDRVFFRKPVLPPADHGRSDDHG